MKLRIALLTATVLAAPFAARAQAVDGPYVSGGLGTTYESQEKVYVPTVGTLNTNSNWGWAGQASVGYGIGGGLRAELEGTYLSDQFAKPTGVGGRENKYGAFANALYDFDLGWPGIYPYLGAGGGYEWVNEKPFNDYDGPYFVSGRGTKGDPAVQGIAGVAFPISGVPGLSLTAEYRFQAVLGQNRSISTDEPGGSDEFHSAYNHTILLGLRYAFGEAPAPAPTPAPPPPAPTPVATPAPAPARTYLVFFDWDKSDLTDKARAIIAQAAQASTQVQTTQIAVNGYTDLSGTAAYNQGLSVRRANAVAAELVRLGVPRTEIDIMGFGENDPLVPTAPGVREPQNRRVEIILK